MKRTENPRNKVIAVYPEAICKREDTNLRFPNIYVVRVQKNGPAIAGGPTAVKAWENSLKKMKGNELK